MVAERQLIRDKQPRRLLAAPMLMLALLSSPTPYLFDTIPGIDPGPLDPTPGSEPDFDPSPASDPDPLDPAIGVPGIDPGYPAPGIPGGPAPVF